MMFFFIVFWKSVACFEINSSLLLKSISCFRTCSSVSLIFILLTTDGILTFESASANPHAVFITSAGEKCLQDSVGEKMPPAKFNQITAKLNYKDYYFIYFLGTRTSITSYMPMFMWNVKTHLMLNKKWWFP